MGRLPPPVRTTRSRGLTKVPLLVSPHTQSVQQPTGLEPRLAPFRAAAARFAPFALALFFALWGLRGISFNHVVDSDAARHAMNGVFIHDLLRAGQIASPIEFGKSYYSRLPALSMPYHPPLFPAIESLFFFAFGVNLFAARLAIAVATAVSAFLFYKLVLATHRSHLVAASSVLAFFSWNWSQLMANDVMLEFPALAFVLGALYYLRDLHHRYPFVRSLLFALLAAAAVWTKQQAVFMGMVPFLFVLVSRNWRLLAARAIWVSSLVFAALVGMLSLLSVPFESTGVNLVSPTSEISAIFFHNFLFYLRVLGVELGILPALLLALALVVFLGAPRRRWPDVQVNDLYLAWAFGSFLILLFIGPYSGRYLFFVVPPLVVIAIDALLRFSRKLLPGRLSWAIPAFAVAAFIVLHLRVPVTFMSGPYEAARATLTGASRPLRILYCGQTDGSFIFAVRSLDPGNRTVVLRGDKLPRSAYSPEAFEQFAHRYGIDYVVIEQTAAPRRWSTLAQAPSPSMALQRIIPLACSQPRWNGELRVYRFTNPSPNPENTLSLPIPMIGSSLEAKF